MKYKSREQKKDTSKDIDVLTMKEISNQALKEEKRTKIIKSTASIYCHQAEVIVTVTDLLSLIAPCLPALLPTCSTKGRISILWGRK
jgi:hypothetical protein